MKEVDTWKKQILSIYCGKYPPCDVSNYQTNSSIISLSKTYLKKIDKELQKPNIHKFEPIFLATLSSLKLQITLLVEYFGKIQDFINFENKMLKDHHDWEDIVEKYENKVFKSVKKQNRFKDDKNELLMTLKRQ